MKKLITLGALAAGAYVLWQKAAHEREERSIWAEVAASFGEYPDHDKIKNPVTYR